MKGGTGSGDVNERYSVTVREGLKKAGYRITSEEWLREYETVYEQARQSWKVEVLRKNALRGENGPDFLQPIPPRRFIFLPAPG